MMLKILFSIILAFPLLLNAKDYPIVFHRPSKIGDRHHEIAKITDENRMTINVGKNPMHTEKDKTILNIQTDIEILEIKKSAGSKLKLLITAIECLQNDKLLEVVPVGTVLIAERNNEVTQFTFPDGNKPPDEVQKILRMAFNISEDPASDDRAFGTKESKNIGDTWPVNSTFAAEDLKKIGMTIYPSDISGRVKLETLTKEQGNECLKISVKLDIRNVQNLPLPPYMKPTKTVFSAAMSGLFPTDLTKEIQQSSEEYDFELLAYGKTGPKGEEQEMVMMGRMLHRAESSSTPLPKL